MNDNYYLTPGLEFVKKYAITQKELEQLILFLAGPLTAKDLVKILRKPKVTIYHTLQRLQIKKLIVIKNKAINGTILFEFNSKVA